MISRAVYTLVFLMLCAACGTTVAAGQPLRLTGPAVREAIPLVLTADSFSQVRGMNGAVFIPWSSPEQLRSLIATQKVDVALMTIAAAALLHNKGARCAVIAAYSAPAWILSTDPLSSLEELDGQEIMLPFGPGEMPELSLRLLMEKRGICFVPRHVGSALEAVAMLRSGRGKHAFLAEPAAGKALAPSGFQGGSGNLPHRCFNVLDLWAESFPQSPEMPFGVVAVFGALAEDQMFLSAIRKRYWDGVDQALEHPDNALAALEKSFPALKKRLMGMSREEVCNIRVIGGDHAAASANFFLARLFEVSPAAIGGKMPDEGFLRLSDAPR